MKFNIAGATHPGGTRSHNEDAYGIDETLPAAVLADGMGGLAHGEVASTAVVDRVLEGLRAGIPAHDALVKAHDDILSQSSGQAQRMGSTAVVLTVDDDGPRIHWVGDSRAYRLRAGSLKPVTRDHSLVQGLIDAGAITESEAESHPNRNVVTRAVGVRDNGPLQVDEVRPELRTGDRLLICSDGLHGYLPEARITEILARTDDDRAAAESLIEATLNETEAGDNITVICATVR